MSKRTYDYFKPTAESIKRQRAIRGWDDALDLAYNRDTKKLSAYLRSDLPLDRPKRDDLANLIDYRIHRKKGKGRKPGRIPDRYHDKITDDYVARLARRELQRIRQRNGGKAPRGSVQTAISNVCQRLADDGEQVVIDADQVLTMLRRGPRRKKPSSPQIA
jgi:hypothetical protein